MDNLGETLVSLEWGYIVLGAIFVFLIGWVWYGVIFREVWMKLDKGASKETDWNALIVQFVGLLALSALLAVFALAEEPLSFLSMAVLVVMTLFMSLAGFMFSHGKDRRKALRLWGIHTGYEIVCILLLAVWFKFIV